ncbi:MAG: YggS family pyridoxal phosphate-dependent enzyme [Clostridium sp.]|nr:YggS family pyridoxal phosphate-dependent enzyme [Clostridium sp.]
MTPEITEGVELTPEEIRENLDLIEENVKKACERAGRAPEEVTICAVSKLKPVEDIRAALSAGQKLFGENYVQEIQQKYEILGNEAEWHMIGHLQRNKVKYIIDKVTLIHSVDSIPLAEQIEKEAAKHDKVMDVLLEVNIAGEESKWGFTAEATEEAAKTIGALPHVRVLGLMTSAPYTEDAETNRVHFRNLRQLFDQLKKDSFPGVEPEILSMGMTGDYVVAVEEGSTMVRVGTGIFGARDYSKKNGRM